MASNVQTGALRALKDRVSGAYERNFTHATLVEGVLKGTTASCRCLLVMPDDSPFQNYLIGRMFGDSFRKVRTNRIWIPMLAGLVGRPPADVDFFVASLPRKWDDEMEPLSDLKSPSIVRQMVDISGDWNDIKKRLNRKKREIFNGLSTTNPFEYRISEDAADFEHFYHRMYLPHISRQFGSAARIDSHALLRSSFDEGFLLLLTDQGKDVAGSLCYFAGDTMTFHRGGVLDGDDEHVRKGAQTALYFFKFRHAKEHGMCRLDLGYSRAFFDDGVYRHKREWGASVGVDDDLASWMYLFDPRRSPKTSLFLANNPLIVQTAHGLTAYCVTPNGTAPSAAKKSDLEKRYYAPGLDGVLVRPPAVELPVRFVFGPTDASPAG
jgi:hypothetical protein